MGEKMWRGETKEEEDKQKRQNAKSKLTRPRPRHADTSTLVPLTPRHRIQLPRGIHA
jgi:hypothetical protein